MPVGRELIRAVALAAALWSGVAASTRADDAPPPADLAALIAAARFGDAYAQLTPDGAAPDPEALQKLARALLVRAIGSGDTFERWAGMRAARGLADPAFAGPARRQLRSGSRYEEALALEILATADPAGSRDEFLAALDSPFRTVRMRALRGLAASPDPDLVPRLMLVANEDADPDVRVLALRTLRAWKAEPALPTFRRAVDDPVAVVQQEAVKALVALDDPEVVTIVRRRINEAPVEQRAAALRLAALVPQRELLSVIGPSLGDPDPEIRAAAARAVLSIVGGAG